LLKVSLGFEESSRAEGGFWWYGQKLFRITTRQSYTQDAG
jgi:hypothetical protein